MSVAAFFAFLDMPSFFLGIAVTLAFIGVLRSLAAWVLR
jgi:hypothetical protein